MTSTATTRQLPTSAETFRPFVGPPQIGRVRNASLTGEREIRRSLLKSSADLLTFCIFLFNSHQGCHEYVSHHR